MNVLYLMDEESNIIIMNNRRGIKKIEEIKKIYYKIEMKSIIIKQFYNEKLNR